MKDGGARRGRFGGLSTFCSAAAAAFLMLAGHAEAQTQIFPQITDGGGWRVAIVLENTTISATTASLSFFQDAANGATTSWNPPFVETSSTQGMPIPAGGTLYLHTPGTAATLSQGWGELTGTGVVGYSIYTLGSYSGRPDQDGTAQAATATTRVLVPFDNTPGFATGMAIVNPTSAAETILVNIQTDAGAVTQTSLPLLPANGQVAIVTAQQFPATNGSRGMAEFYVPAGNLSIAAFRFNPTFALTSLPVFPQEGPPVLGGGSSGGGGLQLISITATPVPDPLQIQQDLQIQVYGKLPNGTYSVGTVDGFGGAGTTAFPRSLTPRCLPASRRTARR